MVYYVHRDHYEICVFGRLWPRPVYKCEQFSCKKGGLGGEELSGSEAQPAISPLHPRPRNSECERPLSSIDERHPPNAEGCCWWRCIRCGHPTHCSCATLESLSAILRFSILNIRRSWLSCEMSPLALMDLTKSCWLESQLSPIVPSGVSWPVSEIDYAINDVDTRCCTGIVICVCATAGRRQW